jgi:drug/metabolite transporter (DMT)-like permease
MIVFPLITFLCFALSDFVIVFAARKENALVIIFWQLLISFVVLSLALPFNLINLDLKMVGFTVLLGLFELMGTIFFIKALARGNTSIVGTISGLSPAIVAVLAVIIYSEHLEPGYVSGIILAFIGFFLVSFKAINKTSGITYAFLAAVFWAVNGLFLKISVSVIGWFWPVYLYTFNWLILFIYLILKHQKITPRNPESFGIIVTAGLLLTAGLFCYNLGLTQTFVSINAAIIGCYPILFVILTRIVFKDKLTKRQQLGILSGLTGLILLNFI